jgi:hypothetical protein
VTTNLIQPRQRGFFLVSATNSPGLPVSRPALSGSTFRCAERPERHDDPRLLDTMRSRNQAGTPRSGLWPLSACVRLTKTVLHRVALRKAASSADHRHGRQIGIQIQAEAPRSTRDVACGGSTPARMAHIGIRCSTDPAHTRPPLGWQPSCRQVGQA